MKAEKEMYISGFYYTWILMQGITFIFSHCQEKEKQKYSDLTLPC